MTEAERLTTDDPKPLLTFLGRRGQSARKRRLLHCACGRHLEPWFPHPDVLQSLVRAERFADGQLSASTLSRWRRRANEVCSQIYREDECDPKAWMATHVVSLACTRDRRAFIDTNSWSELDCQEGVFFGPRDDLFGNEFLDAARRTAAAAVRDLFGTPFRPVDADPRWRKPVVFSLAEAIYTEQSFGRLSELADTLEEAGCQNAVMLNHCRGSDSHFRGCWVLDLILGKP